MFCEQIVLITTGSQGETMAALSRMANSTHRKVSIVPSDTICAPFNASSFMIFEMFFSFPGIGLELNMIVSLGTMDTFLWVGVGDVGNIVLNDRKLLSQNGLIIATVTLQKHGNMILAGPDIVSRGFVYVRESESLMEGARDVARDAVEECLERNY